jgi:hypothetical protein
MVLLVSALYGRYNIFTSILLFLFIALLSLINIFSSMPYSYAHIEHLTHYNQGGDGVGKFYVYEVIEPQYARPGEPAHIMFSIQDKNGKDGI